MTDRQPSETTGSRTTSVLLLVVVVAVIAALTSWGNQPDDRSKQGRGVAEVDLTRLVASTTQAKLPRAPIDPDPTGTTDGAVVHPRRVLAVYATPGRKPFAKVTPKQMNDTWLPVIDQQKGWTQVLLPSRPNGSIGWVRTDQLVQRQTPYVVRVHVGSRRMELVRDGATVGEWDVAVGAPATPTPIGRTFLLGSIVDDAQGFSPVILPLGTHSDTLDTYGGGPGHGRPPRLAGHLGVRQGDQPRLRPRPRRRPRTAPRRAARHPRHHRSAVDQRENTMRTSFKAATTGLAITAAALLVVTASTATSDPVSSSSAYGASVGGTPGQPAVESDGTSTQTGGGSLPAQLGVLAAGGVLEVSAGDDTASAAVTDLTLGSALAQLPPEVKAGIANLNQVCTGLGQAGPVNEVLNPLNDAINQIPGLGTVIEVPTVEAATAFCNQLVDTDILNLATVGTLKSQCTDQTGTVTLSDTKVLGAPQPVLAGEVAPETQLLPPELAAVAKVTLNHQVRDGENFTVEGLRLEVGGQLVAVLASATCGGPQAEPVVQEQAPAKPNKGKQAPRPTPVKTSAPVTG